MKRFLRHNGLSLVLAGLFLVTFAGGQVLTGWHTHNEDRREHGAPELTLAGYLRTAHFFEATSENWESEFLEMFVYVSLTVFLYQRGSAESKDPDKPLVRHPVTEKSPWAVRKGGLWRKLYAHSLSLALAGLFLVAFTVHAWSSTALENEERLQSHRATISVGEHLRGSKFWFQSFQNWQSEFLAIGTMVVLSIFLREKDSPESKPVEAPHSATGD